MKKLGKILKVNFGYGGYQDVMFGLTVTLGMQETECCEFTGGWSTEISVDEYTKWTEADRDKKFAEVVRYCNELLKQAKKRDVYKLVGTPVEVEIDSNKLISWRILTEVL